MKRLAQICIERPVFATVLILSLVVVGMFAYQSLGVDRFPKIDFPTITVTTRLIGAGPEEMETEVTEKIEEAVNTISGIDQLTSTSSEGISIVIVQFALEKDGDVAAQEVRDKVNTVLAELPRAADPPIVEKIDPDSAPVLSVALSGAAPTRDITEFADKTLKRQLESTLGVGQVRLIGGLPRQINVVADTAKLAAQGLTVADLVRALQAQNVQIPGGQIEQGLRDLTLRTYGRVITPAEFGEISLGSRNGYAIKVKDVARVEDSVAETETIARVDGKPAVVLQVRKQSGTNTIEVIDLVKERIEELRAQLPAGWNMIIVRDQSGYIEAAVESVKEHLVLGALFASLIVLMFLRQFRPTIISAVAIPTSLIATFAIMSYMGFTLNIITLLALALVVGIVIDDAVVVLENIFRLLEQKKLTPREAALQGTAEIALAVMATTLSLIAVFLPVAFMGGIVGRFMNSFGITMAAAIAVSLLVSFTLTPMMSSRWLRAAHEEREREGARRGFFPAVGRSFSRAGRFFGNFFEGAYSKVERAYLWLLDHSMAHRWVVVVIMLLVFVSIVPLFMKVNKTFLPQDDESQFEVQVRAPEGASLATTEKIGASIATRIRQIPGVDRTLLTIGDDQQRTKNLAVIYVGLKDVHEREMDQFQIMDKIRGEILPQYAALNLRNLVTPVNVFGGGINAEIMFWIGGPDLDQLSGYSQKLMDKLNSIPGVVDADTNLIVGKPELGVRIDRAKAADLGVNVQDIASTLNVLVGGQEITSFMEGGEQYEVHVRAEEYDRRDQQGIEQAEVPTMQGGTVAVRDVVRLEEGEGPSLVNRIARRRQVMLYANMLPGFSSQTVLDALTNEAKALNMPASYSYGFTGRSREQGRAMQNFMLAFLLSIIFMYLILAAQFESWLHPVTILLALPMTVPFALFSLVVLNQSINIYSMLGILVLFGIVKKNSILQIDHTITLRKHGLPRAEAIRQANKDRLRPILMTTLAFVAGMIPLVASSGTGAATNRAIGSVIIGGQTLALLLTLIGTPVAYSLFDDVVEARIFSRTGSFVKRIFGGKPAGPRETQEPIEPAAV
jgi:hydrophobic/amphiphilic exporter-1 (mainly G- bacteria), HAE1 family